MPDADVNRRYEPLYEQQMDPFKKFKKQVRAKRCVSAETNRCWFHSHVHMCVCLCLCLGVQEINSRIKQLSVTERVALQGGRFMLSNKLTRNFLFFYALSLHVLVFLTLYRLAQCGS